MRLHPETVGSIYKRKKNIMKHLKVFEESSINEAAELGPMPAFLKAAGAEEATGGGSPGAWLAAGKPKMEKTCWGVEVPSPFKKGHIVYIRFFPKNKRFDFSAGVGLGGKFQGSWQESPSDVFQFGQTAIKGVKMTFTLFGGVVTLD
jgi:hypothetical protein